MKKNYYIRNKIALRSQIELEREQALLDEQHRATQEIHNKRKRLQLEYDLELRNTPAGDDNEISKIQSDESSINKLNFLDNNLPSSELQDEILLDEQIEVIHSGNKNVKEENLDDVESGDDLPSSEVQHEILDEEIEGICSGVNNFDGQEDMSDAESSDGKLDNTDLKKSLGTWSLQHNIVTKV